MVDLAGTAIGLSLGRNAGAWDPRGGRTVKVGLARGCCCRRVPASAAQQRPGAARPLGAKVGALVDVPGEASACTATARPLSPCWSVICPGLATTVAVGRAGEAWICLARSAPPVALSASGESFAPASRTTSLGTTAACRLASSRASVLVVSTRSAFALASSAAQAEDDALQGVKAAGEVGCILAARLPAVAATWHDGSGRSPRTLGGVVPLQEA